MLRALGSFVGLGSVAEATNPSLLNINETKFNPKDASHINFIDERLQNFLGKRDALLAIDKKMEIAGGVDTLIWMSGFTGGWGPYLAIAGYLAIYFSAKSYGRDNMKHEFDVALDELFAIYHWYTKDQGPVVTHMPRFQELLSAIIPYTLDWQKLIVWDLKQLGRNDISSRVINIFEQSPHKAIAPLLKLDVKPLSPSLPPPPVLGLPDPKTWIYENNPYQFFAETAANAKLKLLYGHGFDKETQEAPQPRRG